MPQGMMTATCSPLILAFPRFSFSTMNAAILSALLCSVMQFMERVVWPCSGGIREEGEEGRGRRLSHCVCVPVFYVSCAHTVCIWAHTVCIWAHTVCILAHTVCILAHTVPFIQTVCWFRTCYSCYVLVPLHQCTKPTVEKTQKKVGINWEKLVGHFVHSKRVPGV